MDEQAELWESMSHDLRKKFCKLVACKSSQLFMKEYTHIDVWPQWPIGYSKDRIFKRCVKGIDYEELLRILKFFLLSEFEGEQLDFIFDASFLYHFVTNSGTILNYIKSYCKLKYNLNFATIPNCRENESFSDGYHSD